ncbi:hypothetical protein, partial [Streptomyces sp. C]|uniref:hypothetical protein n=1 Tax=Streptomyces sp. C TaxID=253839 RepID=UPI0001B5631A
MAAHESVRGNRMLDGVRAYGGQIDAVVSGAPVTDPVLTRELAAVRRDLAAVPGVHGVTPLTEAAYAADRRAVLLAVRLDRTLAGEDRLRLRAGRGSPAAR